MTAGRPLTDREKSTIYKRYKDGVTITEIARQLGFSKSAVFNAIQEMKRRDE